MRTLDGLAVVLKTERGPVQVARRGSGPKVMSIHGSPGGFDQGLTWAQSLLEGGCELISPSRPGYLRTPLDSGRSPFEQADLYAAMLDVLQVEKVTVLGISSGGPSAVHFAARHPERTNALLLDAAVLLPITVGSTAIERVILESGLGVWFSYLIAKLRPELAAGLIVDGFSAGLSKKQKGSAVDWIKTDLSRLQVVTDLCGSLAPRKFREPGQRNDESNETNLRGLPFSQINSPTLITVGTNDVFPLADHANSAAAELADCELMIVEEGHHVLPLCTHIGEVIDRQLELVLTSA